MSASPLTHHVMLLVAGHAEFLRRLEIFTGSHSHNKASQRPELPGGFRGENSAMVVETTGQPQVAMQGKEDSLTQSSILQDPPPK